MPELSEYTPRIVEYLFDHHYDDHSHLFQVEWHADLDFALAWLRRQEDQQALVILADAWLRGCSEHEMVVEFNVATDIIHQQRAHLCHILSDWLNGIS